MIKWFSLILAISFCNLFSDIGKSFTEFGLSLYPYLEEENENIVFSPYSLGSSLAMIYLGAVGETKEELKTALSLPTKIVPISFMGFNTANSLWINDNFLVQKSYQDLLKKTFQADCKLISFMQTADAAKEINHWIEEKTDGKIQRLCSPYDFTPDTRLVLVNTLSFKGKWLHPFHEEMTHKNDFLLTSGKTLSCPMMAHKGNFLFHENSQYKMAALEFADQKNILFLLFLPHDLKEDLGEMLSSDLLKKSIAEMKHEPLDLILPKFTLRKRVDPKEALRNLDIVNLFSAASDLSGIDGKGELFLDKIIHESYISVGEKGLDAAASSASFISTTSIPPYYLPFHLNRPFLFAIFDQKTQSLLFIGKIESPSEI